MANNKVWLVSSVVQWYTLSVLFGVPLAQRFQFSLPLPGAPGKGGDWFCAVCQEFKRQQGKAPMLVWIPVLCFLFFSSSSRPAVLLVCSLHMGIINKKGRPPPLFLWDFEEKPKGAPSHGSSGSPKIVCRVPPFEPEPQRTTTRGFHLKISLRVALCWLQFKASSPHNFEQASIPCQPHCHFPLSLKTNKGHERSPIQPNGVKAPT